MNTVAVRLSLMLAALALGLPVAQAQTVVRLKLATERLSTDVPVSGRQLVGAMLAPASAAAASTDLLLSWPMPASASLPERLCISYASRDGVYFAQGELEAAALPAPPGAVQVRGEHDARAIELLRALPADHYAVLARSGPCRQSGAIPSLFLTERLGAAGSAAARTRGERLKVWLMLNSQGQTLSAESAAKPAAAQAGNCRALDGGERNKSFDTICEVDLPARPERARITIHRRVHERALEPITLDLVWTAS